jgi:hypothetical protein
MTPETFIKKYEAALATQDWQQVDQQRKWLAVAGGASRA